MSNYNCSFLLADVTRLMRRNFIQQLEGSSITLAQAKALKNVARQQGVRQVELADKLEVQPMTLARLIDQLEQQQLVERRPDPSDRRAYLIYLTEHADDHLKEIELAGNKVIEHALGDLSQQQADEFKHALQIIRNTLLNKE